MPYRIDLSPQARLQLARVPAARRRKLERHLMARLEALARYAGARQWSSDEESGEVLEAVLGVRGAERIRYSLDHAGRALVLHALVDEGGGKA